MIVFHRTHICFPSPVYDPRDNQGPSSKFSLTLSEDGRCLIITMPSIPHHLINNVKKVNKTSGGDTVDEDAHSLATSAFNSRPKQLKTISFKLPTKAPAKCPASVTLPITANNTYFDADSHKDSLVVHGITSRQGVKWEYDAKPRTHSMVYIRYEVAIDGTIEVKRHAKKAKDPLSEAFAGALTFESDDEESQADNTGDGDGVDSENNIIPDT